MYVFRAIKMYKGVSMFKSKAKTRRCETSKGTNS